MENVYQRHNFRLSIGIRNASNEKRDGNECCLPASIIEQEARYFSGIRQSVYKMLLKFRFICKMCRQSRKKLGKMRNHSTPISTGSYSLELISGV